MHLRYQARSHWQKQVKVLNVWLHGHQDALALILGCINFAVNLRFCICAASFLVSGCLQWICTVFVDTGNTQLALQIIKRNQLLPSVKALSSDVKKKPMFQSIQTVQPPPFSTVQRKWDCLLLETNICLLPSRLFPCWGRSTGCRGETLEALLLSATQPGRRRKSITIQY